MTASIRTAALIAVVWGSLLIYAAGCGGGDDEPGGGGDPGAGTITLHSSGGFARERTVMVNADGDVHVVEKNFEGKRTDRRFVAPPDHLEAIRAQLDELDLGSLDLPPSPDCCDIVYYELRYEGETVKTDIATAPDELGDVIDDINGLAPRSADGSDDPPAAR